MKRLFPKSAPYVKAINLRVVLSKEDLAALDRLRRNVPEWPEFADDPSRIEMIRILIRRAR